MNALLTIIRGILKAIQFFRSIFWTFVVKRTVQSYGRPIKANRKTILNRQTILHDNVNFNGLIVTGRGRVSIGNNFHSGTGCKIITQFHNYQGSKIPYDEMIIYKDIIIGDNVWLGDDVTILGGVKIEEGVIIQAGSVVVSDLEYCAIVGGHPARTFKHRDISAYEAHKKAGRYF